MRMCGMRDVVDSVASGKCPFCGIGIDVDEFRDDLSRREFGISGMCQRCQDDMFADGEEEGF